MDLEYEYRLEEMKKHVPFLEKMISKLENARTTSAATRQAQLEKMRTLRNLLLDRKKRMPMKSLLKCEQVLINIREKLEQNETLPGIAKASDDISNSNLNDPLKESKDLNDARNKLKSVMSKTHDEIKKSLPDVTNTDESYDESPTVVDKQPALFQRRPYKPPDNYVNSFDLGRRDSLNTEDINEWTIEKSSTLEQLRAAVDYKKDKGKKTTREQSKPLELSLTLTKDKIQTLSANNLLFRIVHCESSDADIKILQDLRSQILLELEKCSSNTLSNSLIKLCKSPIRTEIEEGEITDSDSEDIESMSSKLYVHKNYKLAQDISTDSELELKFIINMKEPDFEYDNSFNTSNFIDLEEIRSNLKHRQFEDTLKNSVTQPKSSINKQPLNSYPMCELKSNITQEQFEAASKLIVDSNVSSDRTRCLNLDIRSSNFSKPVYNKVSDIDILQALKKEILNEGNISNETLKSSPVSLPVKCDNMQNESKRRISLEKYKQKITHSECSRFQTVQSVPSHSTTSKIDKLNSDIIYRNPYPPSNNEILINDVKTSSGVCQKLPHSVDEVQKMLSKLCPDLINSVLPVCAMVTNKLKIETIGSSTSVHNSQSVNRSDLHLPDKAQKPKLVIQNNSHSNKQYASAGRVSTSNSIKQSTSLITSNNSNRNLTNIPIFKPQDIINIKPHYLKNKTRLHGDKKYSAPLAGPSLPLVKKEQENNNKPGFCRVEKSTQNALKMERDKIKKKTIEISRTHKQILSKKQSNEKINIKDNRKKYRKESSEKVSVVKDLSITKRSYININDLNAPPENLLIPRFDVKKFKIPKKRCDDETKVSNASNSLDSNKKSVEFENTSSQKDSHVATAKKRKRIVVNYSDSDSDEPYVSDKNLSLQNVATNTGIKNTVDDENKPSETPTSTTLTSQEIELTAKQVSKNDCQVNSENYISSTSPVKEDCIIDSVESNEDGISSTVSVQDIAKESRLPNTTNLEQKLPTPIENKIIDDNCDSPKDVISTIDSVLTILQDKSKINEILKKLEQSDNDKLKKKLEKLSVLYIDDDNEDDLPLSSVNVGKGSGENDNTECKVISTTTTKDKKYVKKSKIAKKYREKDKKTAKVTIQKKKKKAVTKQVRRTVNQNTNKILDLLSITGAAKPNRELRNLQNDLKEMFTSENIILKNRKAKLGPVKVNNTILSKNVCAKVRVKMPIPLSEFTTAPFVVLEKLNINKVLEMVTINNIDLIKKPENLDKSNVAEKNKIDLKSEINNIAKPTSNNCIKKNSNQILQRSARSDSSDLSCDGDSQDIQELQVNRKKKRKRNVWKTGSIVKRKRKKIEKVTEIPNKNIIQFAMDFSCFTDINYCFRKGITEYECRLCEYKGENPVKHYRTLHPHYEVPISRLSPSAASYAIEQCEHLNFSEIELVPVDTFECRFCYKSFDKNKNDIEVFFWHIVSVHTGEYKADCSECPELGDCPFHLDFPTTPKNSQKYLFGYLCGQCNYIQISLENLKKHVIQRHRDEHTEVYSVTLSVISRESIEILNNAYLIKPKGDNNTALLEKQSVSSAPISRLSEIEEDKSMVNFNNIKIEKDIVKCEVIDLTDTLQQSNDQMTIDKKWFNHENLALTVDSINVEPSIETVSLLPLVEPSIEAVSLLPQFRVAYATTGSKEYICCLNKTGDHFKTSLLIALKKHVQMEHKDIWDGYCVTCKQIFDSSFQRYTDCLLHYIESHFDDNTLPGTTEYIEPEKTNFIMPKIKSVVSLTSLDHSSSILNVNIAKTEQAPSRPLIFVKHISELMEKANDIERMSDNSVPSTSQVLPIIEKVVSLEPSHLDMTHDNVPVASPVLPVTREVASSELTHSGMDYDNEYQAQVLSNKHRQAYLEVMNENKLAHVYKCPSRYCSFTSDMAAESLVHASAHKQHGQQDAITCCYCKFDPAGRVVDLVTHVLKSHGNCEFACGQCLYRGVAAQLVDSHIRRKHKRFQTEPTILKVSFVVSNNKEERLTREVAVPYYTCNNYMELRQICKFKTYTFGKFYEHLVQRHRDDPYFSCSICKLNFKTPKELVNHSMDHGLKLYQCTWCIFGADNEAEILDHASDCHPYNPPGAYLRIITSKNSASMKVLPLVHFNNSRLNYSVKTIKPVSEGPQYALEEVNKAIALENSTANVPSVTEHGDNDVILVDNCKVTTTRLPNECLRCGEITHDRKFISHVTECYAKVTNISCCPFCEFSGNIKELTEHLIQAPLAHLSFGTLLDLCITYFCGICLYKQRNMYAIKKHMYQLHKIPDTSVKPLLNCANSFVILPNIILIDKVSAPTALNSLNASSLCCYENVSIDKLNSHLKDVHKLDYSPLVQNDSGNVIGGSSKTQKRDIIATEIVDLDSDEDMSSFTDTHAIKSPTKSKGQKEENKVYQPIHSKEKLVYSSVASKSLFPEYVPRNIRYACGMDNCKFFAETESQYINHWKTLHSEETLFKCVHCPSASIKSLKGPIDFRRILQHYRFHEGTLYACEYCYCFHDKKEVIVQHVANAHVTNNLTEPVKLSVITIREIIEKEWQCGLCKYNSATFDQIIYHCRIEHKASSQYRCSQCNFSHGNFEKVETHQKEKHFFDSPDIIYIYYKKGSMSDELENEPRYVRQNERLTQLESLEAVKSIMQTEESQDESTLKIDNVTTEDIKVLCQKYGEFCDPNGLQFKCPLCTNFTDDSEEVMQSHLYEELNHKKVGDTFSNESFHEQGLGRDIESEHKESRIIQLPPGDTVEAWVRKLLQHQKCLIDKNKSNFEKLNASDLNPSSPITTECTQDVLKVNFGDYGYPQTTKFACPKCSHVTSNDFNFHNHLQDELNKIRWRCSSCNEKFITYYQAEIHCWSNHPGQATPIEVTHTFSAKLTWISNAIAEQTELWTKNGKFNDVPEVLGIDGVYVQVIQPEDKKNSN